MLTDGRDRFGVLFDRFDTICHSSGRQRTRCILRFSVACWGRVPHTVELCTYHARATQPGPAGSFTRLLILLVLACCIVLPPVLVFGVYGTEAVRRCSEVFFMMCTSIRVVFHDVHY